MLKTVLSTKSSEKRKIVFVFFSLQTIFITHAMLDLLVLTSLATVVREVLRPSLGFLENIPKNIHLDEPGRLGQVGY